MKNIKIKIKQNILIDGASLLSPFTGVAKYTYENSSRFEEIEKNSFEYFYDYGFHSRSLIATHSAKKSENTLKKIKSLLVSNALIKRIARELSSSLSYLVSSKYDLYWQPNYIPKKVKTSKTVTTVHDFSFYLHPQWHPMERVKYFQKHFWNSAPLSDWIITVSEFTKKEIIDYMDFPEKKISVIHNGIDHQIFKRYGKSELYITKKKLELTDTFLLFVGSIEPRKNLLTLLKAYQMLSVEIKKRYPLVLVGFKGWENTEIMKEIEKEKKFIRYLGYLSDEELAHVYNLATLFIYPSLYEGFGIPPLEAMACGTAVIASKAASIPEVCGEAAEYIDPYKPDDIADKISMLIKDQAKRNALVQRGLIHSDGFTWEKAAKAHLEVFQKVLSS